MTFAILEVVDHVFKVRVTEADQIGGLDLSVRREVAYQAWRTLGAPPSGRDRRPRIAGQAARCFPWTARGTRRAARATWRARDYPPAAPEPSTRSA